MFGISGTALGAILKATKKSYRDIAVVGLIYGVVVLVLSIIFTFLAQTLTTWTLSGTLSEMSIIGGWISGLAIGTWAMAIIGSVLIGISGFISLILGAVIIDAAEAIIKGI